MTENEQHPQDVLRDEILADAQRQAERTLRRARREASGIAETAAAELAEWRTRQLELARIEAQRRSDMVLAGLPVETGRMRARRIEALLQSICEDARQRLTAREGIDCRQTLIHLSAEAIRGMADTCFSIILSEADHALIGEEEIAEILHIADRPDVKLEIVSDPQSRDAGPLVRDSTGEEFWDNRFLKRLERLWPTLRRQIAAQAGLVELTESKGASL